MEDLEDFTKLAIRKPCLTPGQTLHLFDLLPGVGTRIFGKFASFFSILVACFEYSVLKNLQEILRIFLKKVIVTPTCRFNSRHYLLGPKGNQNKNFNKCPLFHEMSEANRDRSYARSYDRSYDHGHMTGATLNKSDCFRLQTRTTFVLLCTCTVRFF